MREGREQRAGTARAADLLRSTFVLSGLLLLLVGSADLIVGHRKLGEYRAALHAIPAPAPPDPAELFPKLSVNDERKEMLVAKIGYYRMLTTAGRILVLLGAGTIGAGVVRWRLATAHLR